MPKQLRPGMDPLENLIMQVAQSDQLWEPTNLWKTFKSVGRLVSFYGLLYMEYGNITRDTNQWYVHNEECLIDALTLRTTKSSETAALI